MTPKKKLKKRLRMFISKTSRADCPPYFHTFQHSLCVYMYIICMHVYILYIMLSVIVQVSKIHRCIILIVPHVLLIVNGHGLRDLTVKPEH